MRSSGVPRYRGGTAIRHCILLKILTSLVTILILTHADASALMQVRSHGITFSFPEGEEAIVTRLAQQTPEILGFLDRHGLPVATPVEVILDDTRDMPEPAVHVIPHREIRIPLRAPGVLEDGYLQADPWAYFYFKGLCLLGIYSLRSGLPEAAHTVFGEISSPNIILPPWIFEGVCTLLYSSFTGSDHQDPYSETLFSASVPDDISRVSNHPGRWPGYFSSRIYGVPFTAWLHCRYGWEKIREFLMVHGGGVIPVEIDLKASRVFGKTWSGLWADFIDDMPSRVETGRGTAIEGYWPDPFIYWNASGIYPGRKKAQIRGRYGYLDPLSTLWISAYGEESGISRIIGYRGGMTIEPREEHLWDPSPGGVAVSRRGSRPLLVFYSTEESSICARIVIRREIPAPHGAIQLSGPVASSSGRVAVAANTGGNWDIWVYDTQWERVTALKSVEMDPWWTDGGLVLSSNASGSFQIVRADMSQVTCCERAAILPRNDSYVSLGGSGWFVKHGRIEGSAFTPQDPPVHVQQETSLKFSPRPYSPWPSIMPDFIAPDFYAGPSDVQAGLATWGRDVTGRYTLRAGFRYSFDLDYLSFQAGAGIRDFSLAFARYPVSYDPENAPQTEESRHELSLGLSPPGVSWVSLSLHRLSYGPLEEDSGVEDHELWGGLSLKGRIGPFTPSLTAETYSGGRRSLYGSVHFVYGTEIFLAALLQAGRSWGEVSPGHGTFRVGGDVGEGYFTRRPSRLFPIRGFPANILEAGKAATSSLELYCPLKEIQRGHKTLPLFLHRLNMGFFFDAGVCSDIFSRDHLLAGAGFELITSMEIAWGNLSAFKVGVAWPVAQPEYLDEEGPVFVLQIGRPL